MMNRELDKITDRLADKCERIKDELVAAMPKANLKEEAVLCGLAAETMQLGYQFALFRQRMRNYKMPPKVRTRPSSQRPL
jgi:hypothetical protein